MSRFTTARISASRVRVGTVLYNGGRVVEVVRVGNDVRIRHQWGWIICKATYRFTYYPNIGRR